MRINIYEPSGDSRIDRQKVRSLIRRILAREGRRFGMVNVIVTDDVYMKQLNHKYFRKRRATNVISFDLDDAAEIYISASHARDTEELYYFIVHGLLHTIGYDHTTRKQNALMNKKCLDYLTHD